MTLQVLSRRGSVENEAIREVITVLNNDSILSGRGEKQGMIKPRHAYGNRVLYSPQVKI